MREAPTPPDGHGPTAARTDPDSTIHEIASRQHGIVSRRQLLGAGVPGHVIDYRVKKHRLRPVHRGVYRIGPVVGRYAREAAAVLACGDRSVLSHRTAAALWELIPPPKRSAPVEIVGPRTLRGPRRGVRLHRAIRLAPDEIARRHGLPLTTVGRTLLDLASCAGTSELERAVARAERRRLVTRDALEALLARHVRRRGNAALRGLLRAAGGPALTRSEAEARFLELIRKGGIPPPRVNATVEGLEVDFLWRSRRLIAEIDGFEHHSGRAAFERDRRRDGLLAAAGFRVVRFTWRQLTGESEWVLVHLAQAMAPPGRERNHGPRPPPPRPRTRE